MSTKTLLIIGVWLVIGVAMASYYHREFFSSVTFTATLPELLARGGVWECKYQGIGRYESVQGTFYTMDGRVRWDTPSGDMHMIVDAEYSYSWMDGHDKGSKTKNHPEPESMKYDCKPWRGDVSLVTLPADVTFANTY